MTGTAMTEANEFHQIYKLGVVPIPTNMPMIRDDQADVIFQTAKAKFEACVDDIVERNEAGQPVLVGTTSVEKSEIVSQMLKRRGVRHEVLNAKYHEREAAIIAQAGRSGAVTVATNMAGRGTDIMLGGNPEFIADQELHQRGLSPVETPEDYEMAWPEAVAKAKRAVAEEHEQVVEAGGLYVLGTERHESRRIDNQLRGRSGRQGDPGESRFYLSLEDDLMRLFNSERVGAIMERLSIPADVPVESKVVTRAIRSAQTQVEQQNFEIRKDVLKYDDVMNRQRVVIYGERRRVLEGADLHEQLRQMVDEVITGYVTGETGEGYPEEWDLDKLWRAFRQLYPITVSVDEVVEEAGGDRAGLSGEFITEVVTADAQGAYERREEEFGSEVMRELERRVVLSVLDRKWREHLYEMDYLRDGIGLRGYGQRDPLVEYQREGYDMFGSMMDGIKEESVGNLFNLQVQIQENPIVEETPADGVPGLGAPASAAATIEAPEATAPDVRPVVPAQATPESRPAQPRPAQPRSAQPGSAQPRSAQPGSSQPGQGGGAHARGATPARSGTQSSQGSQSNQGGQRGQRGQRNQRAQAGQGAQGAQGGQGGGAHAKPAAGQPAVPAGFAPRRAQQLQYSAPSVDGGAHVETSRGPTSGDDFSRVGRNDPCPCGSGRKYKRCHGDPRNAP
jgi:preprotein translocase subunit SecA